MNVPVSVPAVVTGDPETEKMLGRASPTLLTVPLPPPPPLGRFPIWHFFVTLC